MEARIVLGHAGFLDGADHGARFRTHFVGNFGGARLGPFWGAFSQAGMLGMMVLQTSFEGL